MYSLQEMVVLGIEEGSLEVIALIGLRSPLLFNLL